MGKSSVGETAVGKSTVPRLAAGASQAEQMIQLHSHTQHNKRIRRIFIITHGSSGELKNTILIPRRANSRREIATYCPFVI